jgi:plasmid stabilization system protein ParE
LTVEVFLTDAAVVDLESIGDWIAADSPARALTFVELLRERCLQLGEMPFAFPAVPRFEKLNVRRRPVGDYLVFYRVTGSRVEVLHVLHGARDYEPILFP